MIFLLPPLALCTLLTAWEQWSDLVIPLFLRLSFIHSTNIYRTFTSDQVLVQWLSSTLNKIQTHLSLQLISLTSLPCTRRPLACSFNMPSSVLPQGLSTQPPRPLPVTHTVGSFHHLSQFKYPPLEKPSLTTSPDTTSHNFLHSVYCYLKS